MWLWHDPADFGVAAIVPPPSSELRVSMRAGLTEALRTDVDDDSYDLSWLERLPSHPIDAIGRLRQLLQHDPDPIDRHFMFCELEERLTAPARPSCPPWPSTTTHAPSTTRKWTGSGMRSCRSSARCLLGTYRQMAIRQQKAKDWAAALRWAKRGLALYGQNAARPEAVEDLVKRVAAYSTKLSTDGKPRTRTSPEAETAES